MRKQYYAFYPRNFANEYEVFYVETEEELSHMTEWYNKYYGRSGSDSLDRINVKWLRKKGINPHNVYSFDDRMSI